MKANQMDKTCHFRLALPLLSVLALCSCASRNGAGQKSRGVADTLVVMSYNVENFFDPMDNPEKDDDEFTPEGSYHWTETRMRDKARRIAQVVVAANGWKVPDVVGLCEVEGPDSSGVSAADLLVRHGSLSTQSLNYKAVCFPTPDRRGVATAMLYNANTVAPLEMRPIYVSSAELGLFTRDILYAKMKTLRGGVVFHFMVNHWPSKYGGVERTIPLRKFVARRTRQVCDSILATDPEARIVLMGDFNDTACEPSLTRDLGAHVRCDTCLLKNLSADTDEFSYKYRGVWNTIDHVIVSPGVCVKGRPSFSVAKMDFLLEPDERNTGLKPRRTFHGRRYNVNADGVAGVSDHLPVIVKIAY